MKFETRKGRIIFSALEMALGTLMLVALIAAIFMTTNSDTAKYGAVEAVIGKSPDYHEVTAQGIDYKQATEEYERRYKEESERQDAIVAQQNKETRMRIAVWAGAAGIVVSTAMFLLFYRGAVKQFEITDTEVIFTLNSGKQKVLKRVEQDVTFHITRYFSIRYLYIPVMYYEFAYEDGRGKKSGAQLVHIRKAEGLAIAEYMNVQ